MLGKFRLFKQEPLSIRIEELELYLIGKFERQKRETEGRLFSICSEIAADFRSIEQLIRDLRQKTTRDYSNTIKNKFCEKSLETMRAVPGFSGNYNSLDAHVKKSRLALDKVSNLDMKEFRHLHSFSKDMASIAERIKDAERSVLQAEKIINESLMKKVNDLALQAQKISSMRQNLREAEIEAMALESSIRAAEEKLHGESRAGRELEEEALGYSEDKAKIIDLDRQMRALRVKIDGEFSGLDRVFRKFLYYGDITKNESAVLQEYLKSPSEAFLEKDDGKAIKGLMENLQSFRDRESIEMDDEKLARVEDIIRNFKLLEGLRTHYLDMRARKDAMEGEFERKVEPLLRTVKASKSQHDARQREIKALQARLAAKKREAEAHKNEIMELMKECGGKLSGLLGRDVAIV